MNIRIFIIIVSLFLQIYHFLNAQNDRDINIKQTDNDNKGFIIGMTGSFTYSWKKKYGPELLPHFSNSIIKLGYSYGFCLNYNFSKHFLLETDICNSIKKYETERYERERHAVIDPINLNLPYEEYFKSGTTYFKDYFFLFTVKPVLTFPFYKNSKLRFSRGNIFNIYYYVKATAVTNFEMPYEGKIKQTFVKESYVLKNDTIKAEEGYFFLGRIYSAGYEKQILQNLFVFIDIEYYILMFKIYNAKYFSPLGGTSYTNERQLDFINEYSFSIRLGLNYKI